jgi:RimJ/RimL family protein N-acetyltransferase
MKYTWQDYDKAEHYFIDTWENDAIKRFACDGKWSEEWDYYLKESEYKAGFDTFCKVVSLNGTTLAAMIVFCNINNPVGINPIIVNPFYQNKGFGTEIMREFISELDCILPFHRGLIEVGVDTENTASVRLFEKVGFKLQAVHPDGDFAYYRYEIPQQ